MFQPENARNVVQDACQAAIGQNKKQQAVRLVDSGGGCHGQLVVVRVRGEVLRGGR